MVSQMRHHTIILIESVLFILRQTIYGIVFRHPERRHKSVTLDHLLMGDGKGRGLL